MLCVDKQKRLSQRMAYRLRDRDSHRRSVDVWVSVALWCQVLCHWQCDSREAWRCSVRKGPVRVRDGMFAMKGARVWEGVRGLGLVARE